MKDSLQRGCSTIDVAVAAGERVSDLLTQMKQKALAAADTSLDTASRTALNEDFKSLRDQIAKVVSNADFNGVNMIKAGGTTIAPPRQRRRLLEDHRGGPVAGARRRQRHRHRDGLVQHGRDGLEPGRHGRHLDHQRLGRAGQARHRLQVAGQSYIDFVMKLKDTLDAGVGNLVDADLAKESAKLQALQTKQQLGIQALSIANSSSANLLTLFR